MTPNWHDAFAESELSAPGGRLVKVDGKRIAVFRTVDGSLYAVDDQCPHEGYPLIKGALADCVLTCKWHNFKFDLRDGSCIMGDEAVRTFPLRITDGRVEIDIADPPPEALIAATWPSLEGALLERKVGQVARDVVRLLSLGVSVEQLALYAATFDARYAEYGTTHVLAVAVDVIDEAKRRGGTAAALPLMQAFELAAFAHTRRVPRPVVEAADPGDSPVEAGRRLAELVETEQGEAAEALLRGALAKGWGRDVIEGWFYALVCAHFLDFGHALIYQVKVFDLLERVGWEHAEELLVAHLFSIVTGTREDTLPEFNYLQEAWAEVAPRAAEVLGAAAGDGWTAAKSKHLTEIVAHGGRTDAVHAVVDALAGGATTTDVVDALSRGACERLLRFDLAIDRDPTIQHGWLDVTHVLTFANALRHAVKRYPATGILRALLFGARFVNATKVLDADGAEPAIEPVADPVTFVSEAWDFALDDPVTRPIVAVHLVKVLVAAAEESRALDDSLPLCAAKRVLAGPIRERNVARVTHEAIRLIDHGKVPRTLY